MRPAERLALWVLLTLGLCGCTFSKEKKEDEHLAVQEHATQKADVRETETKQTGPETITTTIEEYDDGDSGVGPGADGGVTWSGVTLGAPVVAGREAAPPVGPRHYKKTTIVDQRGAVTDTKAREAEEIGTEDVGLDMTYHGETKTKDAPALAGWLWIAVAVAAVAGLGGAAWKFSLPGKVLSLLRG